MAAALKSAGIFMSIFYIWKAVAELKIVYGEQFRVSDETNGGDAQKLLKTCKETVQEET